jgi:hypothetical protein
MIHVKHLRFNHVNDDSRETPKPETSSAVAIFHRHIRPDVFREVGIGWEWINVQTLFHVKPLSLDLSALMANNTALETCYEL